ncbi:MAG: DNA cytosine methyltransferase [Bacillota bacterium]|nr:DNA cytosine methyltransferase [Bacillota bacterium]
MKAISLFSGAGGLDMGFKNAGFRIVWANDINHDACQTHRLWSDSIVVNDNIKNISVNSLPDTDLILGGFPCQGFSLAGPRRVDDSRNLLYRFYVKAVSEKNPSGFIAENVKGILTLGDGKIIKKIIRDFENAGDGYNVSVHKVNSSDFGVPQDRVRVFIIGISKNLNKNDKFKINNIYKEKILIEDVLEKNGTYDERDLCDASYSSRYMSRNRKRDWNEFSYTIPAMAKQVTLHPSSPDMIKIDKDKWIFGEGHTRRFTWREAAKIQTFPSELEFFGDRISKYRQIGNAVPVKLAEKIGFMIKEYMR